MQHLSTEKQQELSGKWLKGTITADELALLEEWYNQEPQDNIDWEAGDVAEEQLKDRLFNNINQVQKAIDPVRSLINKTLLYKAAAVIIVALGATLYYIGVKPKSNTITKNSLVAQQVDANANKAVLILANGATVVLDKANNGIIAKQGNTQINKIQEGELTYSNNQSQTTEPEINMVSTPAGGKYQITLPDGSKVWLNAVTSLKFPTAFQGKERVVELTGEAYFEVAKDKSMPFKVKMANNTSIKVLGTHFNIMAYGNESSINATLLEGSINVQKGKLSKMMMPGQEAKITDEISLKKVDADESVAWMSGLFSFDRSDIRTVMRQIERWYNVEVVYEGKVPDNQITGYVARSSNLSEVLKMLELSGVKTVTEGKKIKVYND